MAEKSKIDNNSIAQVTGFVFYQKSGQLHP
jgi:hypothetical protein